MNGTGSSSSCRCTRARERKRVAARQAHLAHQQAKGERRQAAKQRLAGRARRGLGRSLRWAQNVLGAQQAHAPCHRRQHQCGCQAAANVHHAQRRRPHMWSTRAGSRCRAPVGTAWRAAARRSACSVSLAATSSCAAALHLSAHAASRPGCRQAAVRTGGGEHADTRAAGLTEGARKGPVARRACLPVQMRAPPWISTPPAVKCSTERARE